MKGRGAGLILTITDVTTEITSLVLMRSSGNWYFSEARPTRGQAGPDCGDRPHRSRVNTRVKTDNSMMSSVCLSVGLSPRPRKEEAGLLLPTGRGRVSVGTGAIGRGYHCGAAADRDLEFEPRVLQPCPERHVEAAITLSHCHP